MHFFPVILARLTRLAALPRLFSLLLALVILLGTYAPVFAGLPSQNVSLTGILSIVYGDPDPATNAQAETTLALTDAGGTSYRIALDATAAASVPEGVTRLQGRRVTVTGTRTATAGSSGGGLVVAQSIVVDRSPGAPTPPGVTGTKPFLSIMCQYNGVSTQPRDINWFTQQLSNTAPGFSNYIRELSYGAANIDGSQAAGWFTLPKTKAQYDAIAYPGNLFTLAVDCTNALRTAFPSFDFTNFFGINLMLNGSLNGFAYGGSYYYTNGIGSKRTTWMPYSGFSGSSERTFGWLEHGILAHEMSHAFGSPHSGSSIGYEYGSSWDAVSNPEAGCTNYYYVNPAKPYGCQGQGVVSYNRDAMGFVPSNRKYNHNLNGGPQTLTLDSLELPASSSSPLMAIIPSRTSPSSRYYTIEGRYRRGYDTKLPGDGVLIHLVDTSRDNTNSNAPVAWLVVPPGAPNDALRGSQYGTGDLGARWLPGTSFADNSSEFGFSIGIGAQSASGFNVTVGPPGMTVSTSSLSFGTNVGNGSPAAQTLVVGNSTNSSFDWNLTSLSYGPGGNGWLSCTPGGGTNLAVGASANVSCSASVGALTPGAYTATFQITSPTALGSPKTVNVSFQIIPALLYYPLPKPVRLLDTGGSLGYYTGGGPVVPGAVRNYSVRNLTTSDGTKIPVQAQALEGTAQVAAPTGAGYLSIYPGPADPAGANWPKTVSILYNPNQYLANAVTITIGSDGSVNFLASSSTNVLLDITGYYAPPATPDPNNGNATNTGLAYFPLTQPVRMIDTRSGPGINGYYTGGGPVVPGQTKNYKLAGFSPAAGVTIPAAAKVVVGTAQVAAPPAAGYLAIYPGPSDPTGANWPRTSSILYNPAQYLANAVTLTLGSDSSVNFLAFTATNVLLDVVGYYAPPGTPNPNPGGSSGLYYNPLFNPTRLVDTRSGTLAKYVGGGPVVPGAVRTYTVAGVSYNGVNIPASAKAIAGNTQVAGPAATGYLSVYPGPADPTGASWPQTVSILYNPGQYLANAILVTLDPSGAVNFLALTSTDALLDATGYFA